MPIGILFWVIWVLWVLSIFLAPLYSGWIVPVLLGLLGWKVFGPVLQG